MYGKRRIPMATHRIWEVYLLRDSAIFSCKHSDGGTGGGCSVVLVVSPLVSLIVYQVASLRSRRVTAAIISYSSAVTDKKLLAA